MTQNRDNTFNYRFSNLFTNSSGFNHKTPSTNQAPFLFNANTSGAQNFPSRNSTNLLRKSNITPQVGKLQVDSLHQNKLSFPLMQHNLNQRITLAENGRKVLISSTPISTEEALSQTPVS